MEYKNKLNKIKAVLSMEVKLAQMKLEDGITVIEAESFEPDYSVGIVTADGIVPMPVGEYKLEDGTILVVEVEGVIKEIMEEAQEEVMPEGDHPQAEAGEPMPQEVVAPEMSAEAPKAKRIVESVSKETFFAEIDKLRQEFSLIKQENEALKAENESLKVEMSSIEEGAQPLAHNPEANAPKQMFKIGKNRTSSIEDAVFNRIFSK
jgi:regulator of replication initiation timing